MCRELLGIQKTLSNIGSELLGIQENQRDANFKKIGSKAGGMKLRPVCQELLGIQEDTAQCGSRITRHSRGPKRTPCKAGGIKISNFPGIQQRRGSPLLKLNLKTRPRGSGEEAMQN